MSDIYGVSRLNNIEFKPGVKSLKKCPLCGSDATIAHFMPEDEHAVICFDCFNESDKYKTVEKAIEEWNRRR